MNMRYKGKTILITGGSSGIGFATAAQLVKEGGRVIITGRNKAKLDLAAETLGDEKPYFP